LLRNGKFKETHTTQLKWEIKLQRCFLNEIVLKMILGKSIVIITQKSTFSIILIKFVDKSRFSFLAQNAYRIYILRCNNFEYLQSNWTMVKLSMGILSSVRCLSANCFEFCISHEKFNSVKMRCKGHPGGGGASGGSLPGERMKQLRSQTSCFSLKRAIKELFVKVGSKLYRLQMMNIEC
jgi:hypothetical protein